MDEAQQGGGFTAAYVRKETRPPIVNEADSGLSNRRGTIAMARTNITNSATCQFFINVVDNKQLDYRSPDLFGYAVFGEVIEGMDVVDRIQRVRTGAQGPFTLDAPLEPIIILSARRIRSVQEVATNVPIRGPVFSQVTRLAMTLACR